MTHDWLEELERLNAERTQGEWTSLCQRSADPRFYINHEIRGPDPDPSSKYEWPTRICQSIVGQVREEGDRIDFAFIAAAANHMTTLLRGYREMREALERVRQWADAYPHDVFTPLPPNDLKRADKLLADAGISIGALHGHWARHITGGIGDIARAAIQSPGGKEQKEETL